MKYKIKFKADDFTLSNSLAKDALYEEGFSSTKGELVLVVQESIARDLKRKFGGSTSSQKVYGRKQSYWTTTNKSAFESAKKYLSNILEDSLTEDAKDNLTIHQIAYRIDKFLTSQGWLLEGDTDVHLVYVTHIPKVNEKFWGLEINLEEKWITMSKISKEEDAYYTLYYGFIEQPELLKFFDNLDFEIFEKASELTGQDITDWFGEKYD